MKLQVIPAVHCGTDRGGEDLYLNLTVEAEGDTPPTELPTEAELPDDNVSGVTTDAEQDEETGELVAVTYTTNHYEFEWTGTPADALALVKPDSYRNPANWRFCHKPGETPRLRWTYSHYVDGNAE